MAQSTDILSRLVGARINRASLIVALELATFIYLTIPALLWIFGWLQLFIAIPLALGLIAAAVHAWKETRRHCLSPDFVSTEQNPPLWSFVVALLPVLVWAFYSGAGGFTPTSPDWPKHFAMMRDLTEASWPVAYTIEGKSYSLVFYLAYYLPAAAVAKIFGWWFGCLALSLWTCLGTVLAVAWFTLLVGRYPVLAALLFIFANGLDFLGQRLVQGGPLLAGTEHLDWWAGLLNLPGHYSQLVWAPQHSLAAWMITGLLAVELGSGRKPSHALLLVALATFWSPFTIIGLIPLALFAWIRSGNRGIFSFPNLFSLPLFAISGMYFLSRIYPSPHGFIWNIADIRTEWPRLFLAHLLEWIVFFLFAKELRKSVDPWLRGCFWTAGLILLVYPFYSYGYANDWAMRTTIPAMFLLWAGVIRSLLAAKTGTETRILALLFLIGASGALHESSRTWRLPDSNLISQDMHVHVPGLDEPYRSQYLGKMDSFFFRHLARTPDPLLYAPPNPSGFPAP